MAGGPSWPRGGFLEGEGLKIGRSAVRRRPWPPHLWVCGVPGSQLLSRMGLSFSYVIPYARFMSTTITATDARAKLYTLLTEVNTSHSPITITGKSGNAVLVSEDDWNAVMETVALHSVPGLVEDINSGRDEPIDTTPLTW